MGGTNFWGRRREEDCFLLPSFDDRILEVVAVFGTVQMAASRIINLQHHRIAQCQTVKITILGQWRTGRVSVLGYLSRTVGPLVLLL